MSDQKGDEDISLEALNDLTANAEMEFFELYLRFLRAQNTPELEITQLQAAFDEYMSVSQQVFIENQSLKASDVFKKIPNNAWVIALRALVIPALGGLSKERSAVVSQNTHDDLRERTQSIRSGKHKM